MSRTTMYAFPESGPGEKLAEFANAWGSAAYVWSSLSGSYLGGGAVWMSEAGSRRLWDLAGDEKLQPCERLTLASTFDRWLCGRESFAALAAAYRELVRLHPPGGAPCHLPAMASLLDDLAAGRKHGLDFPPRAVGWHQTSVAENLWWVREGEGGGRMYDLSRDSGHHWLHEYNFGEEPTDASSA